MTKEIHDTVDDVLTYLEASENRPLKYAGNDLLPSSIFDGVVPFDDISYAIQHRDRKEGRRNLALWPIDVSWCLWQDSWGSGEPEMSFHRLRSVTAKEVRGHVSLISSHMLKLYRAVTLNNGVRYTGTDVLSLVGDQWINARKRMKTAPGEQLAAIMAQWVALQQYYEWSVLIGYEGTPRVRLFTDPIGLREIFKLRDIPPGRERRAALRNWVMQHWRRKRIDEDATIWVRRHLRGAVDFTWEGLRCAIQPAIYDLEQNALKELANG